MISTWQSLISTCQNKSFLFLITVGLLTAPAPVGAFEFLHFKTAETNKEKRIISFIKKQQQSTDIKYKIAKTDLNNDLLNEYIIKPENCSEGLCNHHIVALMDGKPIELLNVKTRKVTIADTHRYGVRDLIIYASETNDFQKTRYYWIPSSFSYEQNLGVKSR